MVQFLSIIFFLGFLQFLLGFSKVPVFCVTLYFFPTPTILGSFSNNAPIVVRFKIHALIFKRDIPFSHSRLTANAYCWLDTYLGYAQIEFRPGHRLTYFYCLTQ